MKMNWNQLLSKNRFYPSTDESTPTFQTDYTTIICSTLFRRLQQIREMTGIHLEDQKEMLALQLSFYLLQEH